MAMDKFLDLAMELATDGRTTQNLKDCYGSYDRICLINSVLSMRNKRQQLTVPQQQKNNKTSEKFRLFGNTLFSSKKWFDALECYNRSICYATKNSEQLGIGYANRSAVYLELKEYTLCMENISFAKSAGLPDRLMNKLHKREVQCSSLMETENGNGKAAINQPGKEEPKLSRKAHTQVPYIVDCLEMKTNIKDGRNIITNEDLKPGEIVAIEDSFVHGTYEDFNYRRCTYCMKDNMLSLIPCDVCTNTMFCAECSKREREDIEDFHRYECPITDFLASFQRTRFVLRLVLRALFSCSGAEDLIGLMQHSTEHTIFSFDQLKPLTPKQQYLQVHSLQTNEEKQSEMDLVFRSMYSMLLYGQLLEHTSIKEILSLSESEGARVALADIINHSFMIIPQNGHIVASFDETGSGDIGGAVYPFASLLNHSCSPNVFRISAGTKQIIVVLRNIKKGEQLLDCYS